jgi:sterol desaturase/sphingolipid hydroxylase (fatty acid hydroxylase superfamily)
VAVDAATSAAAVVSLGIGLCVAAGLVVAAEEWRWLKGQGCLTALARREMVLSLSLLPVNIVVTLLLSAVWAAMYLSASQLAVLHLEVSPLTVLGAFLVVDLTYYWEHRCAHRVGSLWRLYHAPHHSSPALTVATAYRVSFANQMLSPAFYLPAILIGLPPLLVIGFQLFCFHYQAWVHTEMVGTLGWLDRVFNTPANHRIHHSIAARHCHRNYGAVLMVWDRSFGTYAEPEAQLQYGIAGERSPQKWWQLYTYPWQPRSSG